MTRINFFLVVGGAFVGGALGMLIAMIFTRAFGSGGDLTNALLVLILFCLFGLGGLLAGIAHILIQLLKNSEVAHGDSSRVQRETSES